MEYITNCPGVPAPLRCASRWEVIKHPCLIPKLHFCPICFLSFGCTAGPPPAQRLVELDDGHQVETPSCGERELRVEKIALGCKHIQIVGEPALVAQLGEMQSRPQSSDLGLLRLGLLPGRAHRDEGVLDLPEGHEDDLLVLG